MIKIKHSKVVFSTLFVVPVPTVLLLSATGRRPFARQCVARFQFPPETFRHVFAIDFFVQGCHCFECGGFEKAEQRVRSRLQDCMLCVSNYTFAALPSARVKGRWSTTISHSTCQQSRSTSYWSLC